MTPGTLRRLFSCAGLAACLSGGSLARLAVAQATEREADTAPRLIDVALPHASLRGGLLFTDHQTRARVDSELLGTGTLVDVERELGLDEWTRDARIDASLRIGKRHQIQAGYVALTRRGRASLNRSIQWGDAVLSVDVEVESRVDVTLIPITYRYSVIQNGRMDLGVSAGVFALFLDAGVVAQAASVNERGSAEFPLPVIGADGVVALFPRLFLTGGGRYFALRVSGVDGVWREFRSAVEYFPTAGLGVGVGYRVVSLEADATGGILSRPEGTLLYLDYEFTGPNVYLTLSL